MATYKIRGSTHNVIYYYKDNNGISHQHWESYTTELEAIQRKAYVDHLQKNKKGDEIYVTVMGYKHNRSLKRKGIESFDSTNEDSHVNEKNINKTYFDFQEKWLPYHTRKMRLSPKTYDSYQANLKRHILPFFGYQVMNCITSEGIDDFIDYLSKKNCKGSKKTTLSSGSVKKCYNILTEGFSIALKWGYIKEIPITTSPTERWKKRKAWEPEKIFNVMDNIKDDPLAHLTVHIGFACSMRAGEVAGIDIKTIDFNNHSFDINQEVQRVSDESLQVLPKNEIFHVFPKLIETSNSSLILKRPKTEGSNRKQYLTSQLTLEIKDRLNQIEKDKMELGDKYQDNGLLICQPNGRPYDPKRFCEWFKSWQKKIGIQNDEQIDFQGLRKSGQMHKIRISKNNYQLVAENSGQSTKVLMKHYNEILESEKRTLTQLVEQDFYKVNTTDTSSTEHLVSDLLSAIQNDPEIANKLLHAMLKNTFSALDAQDAKVF